MVTITNPPTGALLMTTNLTLSATASDTDGTVTQVQFYAKNTLIGTVTNSPYTTNWLNPSVAGHNVTARAWDNAGNMRISAVVFILLSFDTDGDGISNAAEIANGTNPFLVDTDGDGVADGQDAFPLDPARWLPPSPNPSDHTPPTITLDEPSNVTQL